MPNLIRLYITQVIIGFVISAVFVATLLWFNTANLWHLVSTSDVGILAVFLLWFFNGIVVAGVQFGIAVMNMAEDDDEPRDGRREPPVIGAAQPLKVDVQAARKTYRARNL